MTASSALEQSWTVGALLNWTAGFLAQKGSETPRVDAEVLLAHVLECKRIDLYGLRFAEMTAEPARQRYRELIRKRIEGCPVAYLVGRKEFFSLEFEVSPAVLIPRPDSELVVTECLTRARPIASPRIIDIGVGSGNLAVSLAKQLPSAQVAAVDISGDALAVARRNAEKHGVAQRISFLQSDLFAGIPTDARFDFIVSNPPYISQAELPKLPIGVRDYEPRLALDGGPDGYAVFERLISEGLRHLEPGGWLIVEIGSPQHEPARERIGALPGYDLAPTVYDYSGHPRVLVARRKA
jgi:release factor glutamine methyltransferase